MTRWWLTCRPRCVSHGTHCMVLEDQHGVGMSLLLNTPHASNRTWLLHECGHRQGHRACSVAGLHQNYLTLLLQSATHCPDHPFILHASLPHLCLFCFCFSLSLSLSLSISLSLLLSLSLSLLLSLSFSLPLSLSLSLTLSLSLSLSPPILTSFMFYPSLCRKKVLCPRLQWTLHREQTCIKMPYLYLATPRRRAIGKTAGTWVVGGWQTDM